MTITIKARTFDDGDAYHATAEAHDFGAASKISRRHALTVLAREIEQATGWRLKATRVATVCGVPLDALLTFSVEARDDNAQS